MGNTACPILGWTPGSHSAPAQQHLPCTSGRGPPRTVGERWPGSSSHRTNNCLWDRELHSPRAGTPYTPPQATGAGASPWSSVWIKLASELHPNGACPWNHIQMQLWLPMEDPHSTLSPSAPTALSPLRHGTVEKGPTTLAEHSQHLTPLPRRDRTSVYLPASHCCS